MLTVLSKVLHTGYSIQITIRVSVLLEHIDTFGKTPIMLTLCLMLLATYYAQTGIIGWSLIGQYIL